MKKLLIVMSMLLMAGLVGGCTVIGAFSHLFNPPRVEALYKPDKKAPMLIMVENRRNPGMLVPEAEELSVYIARDLERENVAPLIPLQKLQEVRDRDPEAVKNMSISAIGRAVGAQQVLYVDIVSLQASDVAGMPTTASTELKVHIVDAASGKTLWPIDAHEVRYETAPERELRSGGTRGLRQNLLEGAAVRVGRLFYKWDPAEEER